MCPRVCLLIKVQEALLPVGGPSYVSTLIQKFDTVEVQHKGVGSQESSLGFPSALEFLTEFRDSRSDDQATYNTTKNWFIVYLVELFLVHTTNHLDP